MQANLFVVLNEVISSSITKLNYLWKSYILRFYDLFALVRLYSNSEFWKC